MILCDRCGKQIYSSDENNRKVDMVVYYSEATYDKRAFDLCKDCRKLFETYKNKMESYFMTHEDPDKIFDNEKYWDREKY